MIHKTAMVSLWAVVIGVSVVFVVGCSDGLLPLQYADSAEQVEEERRLAYVAVTRAACATSASVRRATAASPRAAAWFCRSSSTACRVAIVAAVADSELRAASISSQVGTSAAETGWPGASTVSASSTLATAADTVTVLRRSPIPQG